VRTPPREPSLATLIAYGLPAFPLAVLTLPLYVVVPNFYAAGLAIPIAAVGTVLFVVRLFDAISDPVVGYLADRSGHRFGRRRTWFLAGVPLTVLGAIMVFRPQDGADATYLLVWAAILSLGWTFVLIPYSAWGAELSQTYAGRSRVTAVRESIVFIGTLAALVVQATTGEPARTLAIFALIVGIGLPVTALLAGLVVPEPQDRSTTRLDLTSGLAAMAANRPFLRLVAAFLVNGLANGLPATLFLFFVAERLQAPDQAGLLLVTYFACGILGVPVWLWISARTSKHRAWCLAMLMACAAFIVAPFLGPGDVTAFLIVCVITGLAVGADLVLPPSIQADVIDLDTARSGEQRSALYMSVWALATKLALAAAVGIAFPVLAAFGFDPGKGLREAAGLTALGWLYAGVPVALKLVAIALMWTFPLTRRDIEAMRA
jgi:glycoside/pentoside/hexuronide:cation symporter, GPH family